MNGSEVQENLTAGNYTDSLGYQEPPISLALKVGMTSAYVVIFLIGFLGNAIGIYVVCRQTGFRMVTNLLIANMAIADLLVCVFSMPASVVHLYIRNKWLPGTFGIFLCKMVSFSMFVSLAASVFTIVFISVERFIAVFFPLRCELLKRPKLLTVMIWAISALVMLPSLFLFTVWTDERHGEHYCVVSWPWGDDGETLRVLGRFFTLTFVFMYCCPVLFLAILYTMIARKLWVRAIPGNDTQSNRGATQRCRKKVIKLLMVVVALFAVCWFPTHVMHYFLVYDSNRFYHLSDETKFLSFFVSHANSSINPILYILLNEGFRKDFNKAIWTCLSRSRDGCCSVPRVLSHLKSKPNTRTSSSYMGPSQNRRLSLMQLLQAMRGTIGSALTPNTRLTPVDEEQKRKSSFLHQKRNNETRF